MLHLWEYKPLTYPHINSLSTFYLFRKTEDRMTSNWNQEFLQRCQAVSNLTVVCSDGVIFSHKLLAASASDFFKSLLNEVPPHDEVTLYLPDLTKSHVEMWFYSVLNNEKLSEMDISEKLKPDPLVCIGIKKEQEWKDDDEDEDKYDDDEGDADKDMFVPNMISTEESKTSFSCVSSDKKRRKVKKRKYGIEEMKMRFENAKAEVLSGKSNSSRATARKFDVPEATLRRLLETGQTYKGGKKGSAIFSTDEEKSITERIIEGTNGGEDLTISIVRNFLREEIINIKVNEPHREEISKLCPDVEEFKMPYIFAYNFAHRNGLRDLMKKVEIKPVADEVDDNKLDSGESANFSKQISIEELQEEENELKKELIPNPMSKKDKLVNDRIEKKIKFGKAMVEVLSGKSNSTRATARKFDVSEATLRNLLKSGRTFKGQTTSARLTQEEEKSITKRILERTNGGQDLTLGIVQNILIEELNIIKVNEPQREEIFKLLPDAPDVEKSPLYNFAYAFAQRNRLHALATQKRDEDLELRRNYECDLCEKRYTWKNALTEHRRRVHLL